jgi:superfamily I DNA/RNA helicase
LTALAENFGIETETAHRALGDVRTNIRVFHKMIQIDEAFRARGFMKELPIILAVACAVDEMSDSDPSLINQAAARLLGSFEGEVENHPFVHSLKDDLTDSVLKNVTGILKSLVRIYSEDLPEEAVLASRIQMLREEALRLEDEHKGISLGEFLAHIVLLTDGDFDSDEDAVKLMTLHAAKGLEFDRVIILGMEQGNLPHRLALNKTVQEVEEERRLCYVGLTRARKRAGLIYARRRDGRWHGQSMFLHELPPNSCKRYRTKDRVSGK